MNNRVNNVEKLDSLVGRAVVSLETANKLGEVADLLIDPISGELAGLAVKRTDESHALVSILDLHSIGPDAVILEGNHSLVLADASPLNTLPLARTSLIGVKVITEHGQQLGNISNLFLCHDKRPVFIYEVRSSLLDKLLGRAFYFAASLGCALSDDRSAMVVTADPAQMDHRVEAAVERLLGPRFASHNRAVAVRVEVRSQPTDHRRVF